MTLRHIGGTAVAAAPTGRATGKSLLQSNAPEVGRAQTILHYWASPRLTIELGANIGFVGSRFVAATSVSRRKPFRYDSDPPGPTKDPAHGPVSHKVSHSAARRPRNRRQPRHRPRDRAPARPPRPFRRHRLPRCREGA